MPVFVYSDGGQCDHGSHSIHGLGCLCDEYGRDQLGQYFLGLRTAKVPSGRFACAWREFSARGGRHAGSAMRRDGGIAAIAQQLRVGCVRTKQNRYEGRLHQRSNMD